MASPLTARQQVALDKIQLQQGSLDGIDKGMIAALIKKGALSGAVAASVVVTTTSQQKPKATPQTVTNYTSKNWNTLGDVRDRIVADGTEQVESFDGAVLITNKHRYVLAFGELTATRLDQ